MIKVKAVRLSISRLLEIFQNQVKFITIKMKPCWDFSEKNEPARQELIRQRYTQITQMSKPDLFAPN
jgi:hypothetical protein